MRDIKFRVKIIKTGKWIQGHLEALIWGCPNDVAFQEYYDENSFGEFIHQHDRKSNEIYEGDILYIPEFYGEYKEFIGVVKFNEDLSCWVVESKHDFMRISTIEASLTEIKGNIYDNPELVEVE